MASWRAWFAGSALMGVVMAACGGTTIVDPGSGGATSTGSGGTGTTGSGASGSTSSSSGTGGSFGACNGPGQCTLTFSGCCGPCGIPELDDLVPVALDQLEAFRESTCTPDEPCPDCLTCPNGNLFSYCETGSCAAAHLDDFDLRACTNDDDCRLRYGTDCYEPCGAIADCGGLTAVSIEEEPLLGALVCDPDAPPPPPCVPTYPDNAAAFCNAGTCEVVFAI